jgi:hypothetical protein
MTRLRARSVMTTSGMLGVCGLARHRPATGTADKVDGRMHT